MNTALRLTALLASFFSFAASLLLPSTWGSAMVLQAGIPNTISGIDAPGATIKILYASMEYTATCDASGAFSTKLAAQAISLTGISIFVNSSSGASLVLEDVVHGDVFLVSGQSNAQSPVQWQLHYAELLAAAANLGPSLRLFQVARLNDYYNTSSPQTNLTASIPWSRASAASAIAMSALGYLFGVQAVSHRPDTPIGIIDSSWGGTAIQPWCSPAALQKCGAARPPPLAADLVRAASASSATRDDLALGVLGALLIHEEERLGAAIPSANSVLYNSMIAPLQQLYVNDEGWRHARARAPPHLPTHTHPPLKFVSPSSSSSSSSASSQQADSRRALVPGG